MAEFVDANVFVRLMSGDDPGKARDCQALFRRVRAGHARLITSESVITEVVYVLSSHRLYAQSRVDIAQRLRPLVKLRGLQIEHKRAVIRALDRYEQSTLAIEDCLSIEHMRRLKLPAMYSYDRGFDRIPSVRRLEP